MTDIQEINDSDISSYVANLKEFIQTLFLQLNRTNIAYSNLDPSAKYKLIFPLNAFEANLSSYIDDEYLQDIENYKTELRSVLDSNTTTVEEKERAEIKYLDSKFKRLIKLMDEAGFTPARNYTDVVVHPGTEGYEYIKKLTGQG